MICVVAISGFLFIDFAVDLLGIVADRALAAEGEQHWIAGPGRFP